MNPEQEEALAMLMARTQRADAAAYDLLLEELQTVVRRFVRRRVGDVPWVEDVVQETLIAVHRGRHSWNPARPFVPWLYAVAHSRLIDVIRRERCVAGREVSHDGALAASTAASGGLAAEWMCPNMAAMHMLVWHAAPVLVVVVAVAIFARTVVGHIASAGPMEGQR